MNTMNLKTAVVTGSTSGIGLSLVQEFVRNGYLVFGFDISQPTFTHEHFTHRDCDVTRHEAVALAINEILAQCGRIDVLINNAGIGGTLPLRDADMTRWNKIISLNLMGAVNCINVVYPHMVQHGGGAIINVSSIAGLIPFGGQVLYNTTKFAITGMTLSMRKEAGKQNIRMCLVCPGPVKTSIFYKPIIGDMADQKTIAIPPESIDSDIAAQIIYRGFRDGKDVIIFPFKMKVLFLLHRMFGLNTIW